MVGLGAVDGIEGGGGARTTPVEGTASGVRGSGGGGSGGNGGVGASTAVRSRRAPSKEQTAEASASWEGGACVVASVPTRDTTGAKALSTGFLGVGCCVVASVPAPDAVEVGTLITGCCGGGGVVVMSVA